MNFYPGNSPQEGEAKAGSMVPVGANAPAVRDPYSSAVGHYVGPAAEAPSSFQLDLLEYLRIAVKRRWLILSIVAAALIIGALTTLMKTPLYMSMVRIADRSECRQDR